MLPNTACFRSILKIQTAQCHSSNVHRDNDTLINPHIDSWTISSYRPRGLTGDEYEGLLAHKLREVARERKYHSPYWVTRLGAQKSGFVIPGSSADDYLLTRHLLEPGYYIDSSTPTDAFSSTSSVSIDNHRGIIISTKEGFG
eukprot:Tbor_TRINITY_DN9689_c0_g1::TRINITY_DN9689_c0_g1_i1::g.23593::m.23593